MGTTVEVVIAAPADADGSPDALLGWAVDEFERLEQAWSRFRPDSELCRLNADRRVTVPISLDLLEVVTRALDAWRLTDGRFDPTVIGTLEALGYDRTFQTFDLPLAARPTGPAPTMTDVQVDPVAGTIRRPVGVRFDLGGIGKGLAVDQVASGLIARGAAGACVGAGGDIRVAGTAPSGGWRIPVEDPVSGGDWFVAALTAGAIVTSTSRYRRWLDHDGRVVHHLIDPGTGQPAQAGIDAVVVAAGDAWWAEVLAKSALIAGPGDGRALLERFGVTSWMVESDLVAS